MTNYRRCHTIMINSTTTQPQANPAFTGFVAYAQTHLHWTQTQALHYWLAHPHFAYQLGQQLHH